MKYIVLLFSFFFWSMITLFLTAYGGTMNNIQSAELTSYDLNITTSDVSVIGLSNYTFLNNFMTGILGAPAWLNVLLGVLFAINVLIILSIFVGIGG